MDLLFLSFRNVFRNKRRSLLNGLALCFSIVMLIFGLGWIAGYETFIYTTIKDFQTGDLQIVHSDYLEQKYNMPVDINVTDYEKRRLDYENNDLIRSASGRLQFPLSMHVKGEKINFAAIAVDNRFEFTVSALENYIVDGVLADNGVLVGKDMADKIGLQIGDDVILSATDRYSAPNIVYAKVSGFFYYNYGPLDDSLVYMNLNDAWHLTRTENEVSTIVLRTNNDVHTVQNKLNTISVEDESVVLWEVFAEASVAATRADIGGFYIMLVVMFFLILIGIINSMSMSIHERHKEIGTLRAIGMKRKSIVGLFVWESAILGILSAVAACILALPVAWFLNNHGIQFAKEMSDALEVPFGENFKADFQFPHFILSALTGVFIAVLGAIRPAIKASKLVIAKTMGGGTLD